MSSDPIVVETLIEAPVEKVWTALTDPDEMKKWYFDLPGFKAEHGYEFSFWGGTEEKQFLHLCKVTEVFENKKIEYTWRYDNIPGDTLVSFELFEEGYNTRVRLTHTGFETFPSDIPELDRENFVKGWNAIIGDSLKKYF